MPLLVRSTLLYRACCDYPRCTVVLAEFALHGPIVSRQAAVAHVEQLGWRQVVDAGRQKAVEQIAVHGRGEWPCPRCVRAGRAKVAPLR